MNAILDDEEILELAETRLHLVTRRFRIPDVGGPATPRRLAAAIVLVLSTAAWVATTKPTPVAPVAERSVPLEIRAVATGPVVDGGGPLLIVAEPAEGAMRIVSVDLSRLVPDDARESPPDRTVAVVPGLLLEGPTQGQGTGTAAAFLAYESRRRFGSVTSLWLVRRGERITRPLFSTTRIVEGFALHGEGLRVAASLEDPSGSVQASLWRYGVGEKPARIRSAHLPGATDPTHNMAPVAWTSEGILAVPSCLPCRGAFVLDEHGASVPFAPLVQQRVFAYSVSRDGSVGAFQTIRVQRCRGRRAFCDSEPFRLLAGNLNGDLRILASSSQRAFDRVAVSPAGARVAYSTDAPDTIAWRPVGGGAERRFTVRGAEVRPSLWVDERRLVVVARRTLPSGGVVSTVSVLVVGDGGAVATAALEGADLQVLGWLG